MIFDPSPTEIEPPLTPSFISPGLVFLTIVPDLANVTWEWSGDAPSCHHPLMQIPVGRKFIIEIISLELCWIKQAKRCLIRELKLRLGDTVVANPKTWHIYQKKIPYAVNVIYHASLSKVYFFLLKLPNSVIHWKKSTFFFWKLCFSKCQYRKR